MVALTLVVARTRLGKAMRATAFDREAAAMMGIDVDRVIASTFFIGSVLAGAAGVMFGLMFSQIFHFMGFLAGLKGFTAAVVGGIGSIPGAMLGGLLVGLVEAFAQGYLGGQWSDVTRLRNPDRRPARPADRAPRRSRDPEGLMDHDSTDQPPESPPSPIARASASTNGSRRSSSARSARGRRRRWLSGSGRSVTPGVQLALVVVAAALVPLWLSDGDLFNYGIFVLLYVLLGLGLNVVVGFAGLLDLGYVAFFGFGAYFYALLSSDHYGIHWPAIVAIPVVVAATSLLGLFLGVPSRRLLGDYLAIVTLFFGQAFVVFVNASNPQVAGKGLTGGPNGIADIDPVSFFGYEFTTRTQQYCYCCSQQASSSSSGSTS